jgi:hypothetical protein
MKSKLSGALAAAGYALALSVGAPASGNADTFTSRRTRTKSVRNHFRE